MKVIAKHSHTMKTTIIIIIIIMRYTETVADKILYYCSVWNSKERVKRAYFKRKGSKDKNKKEFTVGSVET
jgi:hypothetical protein